MSGASGAHTILVVEDDRDTRETLARLLEQYGYVVATAQMGADALRQLKAGLPASLIVLDLNLPEKNGFQFRVEQVVDPRLEHIPVIACSAYEEASVASLRLGAVACLRKPFTFAQLLTLIRTHCQSTGG